MRFLNSYQTRRAADHRRAVGLAEHAEAGARSRTCAGWPTRCSAARAARLRRRRATWRASTPGRHGDAAAARRTLHTAVRRAAAAAHARVRAARSPRARGRRASTSPRSGMTAEDAIRAEHQRQAAAQVSVANAITSLRLCATLDWSEYVERVSLVEQRAAARSGRRLRRAWTS